VIAVEPQPELARYLRSLYASTKNVTVMHGAVGESVGEITLHIPGDGPSHGATIREIDSREGGAIRDVRVPCFTLGAIAEEHGLERLDFIKCDAEGAERAIFDGGRDALERFKPCVLVECERRHAGGVDPVGELWSIFETLGYEGHCFCGGRMIPIDGFDYDTHQTDPADKPNYGNNFFFTHPDRTA